MMDNIKTDLLRDIMDATIAAAQKYGLTTLEDPYFFRFQPLYGCVAQPLQAVESYRVIDGQQICLRLCEQPFVSKNDNALQALCALDGIELSKRVSGEYPTRKQIDTGAYDMFKKKGGVIVSSDTILHLHIDGELKIVQTMRDAEAPIYPNYWSCAGGYATESPSRTAIKELNEETGIVIDRGPAKPYGYLLFSLAGETGISITDKAETMDKLRKILSLRYPSSFDPERTIEMLPIELEKVNYPSWSPSKVVTLSPKSGVCDYFEALAVMLPQRSTLTFLRPVKVPSHAKGLPELSELKEGVNCFFADLEFQRVIHPFNKAEIALIHQSRKYFDSLNCFIAKTGLIDGIKPASRAQARTKVGRLINALG